MSDDTGLRLSAGIELFITAKKAEGYAAPTIKAYRFHLGRLATDLEDPPIDSIALGDLRDHVGRQEHLAASTRGLKVRAIRSLFRWLHEEEHVIRNAALKLREPKQPKRIPKALTLEEVELLRDACRTTREHALVEALFATGCRLAEIHALNRSQVDWQRRAVIVFGKGSREREVYFGAKAAIWLRRYLDERQDDHPALLVTERWYDGPTGRGPRRLSKASVQRSIGTLAARCGLDGRLTPHVLRHTLATTMLNQGAPIAVVQTILGHQNPSTTQLYAHLSGKSRQDAYQRYFVQ